MTLEEIKENTTMREILARYSLPQPDRRGFILCPFHADKSPSMRIYERDYYCFGCGEGGDVFDFVQRMENLTFREAFEELGGTYPKKGEEPSFRRRRLAYQRQKGWEAARNQEAWERQEKQDLIRQSNDLYWCVRLYQPLSDAWCDAYNAWQKVLYRLEYLNGKR